MKRKLWDIRRNLTYIKVGSFFLVAIAILFFGLISIREVSMFKGSYILRVKFTFAEGLRSASPVRFCGVDVGEVKKVEVAQEKDRPIVIVYAKVQNGISIPRNAHFFVNSLSLFGEKYLEIVPVEKAEGYWMEGEIVEGISPIPIHNVFVTFDKTMKEVSDFVKDGQIKTSFENTLLNLEETTEDIKGIVESVRNKEGTIGKLFYDDSLYKTTEEFIDDLKQHPWKLLHKPKEKKARR